MCEIYAYSGEVNKTFNDELREFFSHSGEHPNGWGLAVEEDGRMNLEKEAVQASESRYLRERLRQHLHSNAKIAEPAHQWLHLVCCDFLCLCIAIA